MFKPFVKKFYSRRDKFMTFIEEIYTIIYEKFIVDDGYQ